VPEEQIERLVARRYNQLDKQYMGGLMPQSEYERRSHDTNRWVSSKCDRASKIVAILQMPNLEIVEIQGGVACFTNSQLVVFIPHDPADEIVLTLRG
jgi:uncharacterized protein (DUF2384 family)